MALMTLSGLFLTGLFIQQVWQSSANVPEGYYAAVDSAFAAQTADLERTFASETFRLDPDTTDTLEEKAVPEATSGIRMDINAATTRQLQQLSGIGPVLAERITTYRSKYGPFQTIDELLNVSGIGPKTLSDIRALLFVEGEDREDS